jgi:hypothetical protein
VKRAAALLACLLAVLAAGGATPAAAQWRSQQPLVGPEGATRAPLGEVGDIECWRANRCVLITAGNEQPGMPAGLYAYDGRDWRLYSTVCGGHGGRIAWAGPTEFWTVSDQQRGQGTGDQPPERVSLCHFKDGEVVASHAKPVGVAESYLPMSGAACLGPYECWFAGERLPGTVNVGAFHLHWNGLSVSAAPSLVELQPEIVDPGRSVVSLAYHDGRLYEGVRVQADDEAADEPADQPHFVHRIVPGTLPAFVPQVPLSPIDFGDPAAGPDDLEGFLLSSGGDGDELWAVSGTTGPPADVAVLRLAAAGFEQLALSDPGGAFKPGDRVTGLAAEPGAAAWVGLRRNSGDPVGTAAARLARIHADGTVEPPLELPAEGEGISNQGRAGPIACPEAEQCWMATERGWLFHLGEDPVVQDTSPAMHTLITFRPRDESLPDVPPISLPVDDSGAYQAPETPLFAEPGESVARRLPALYSRLRQRLIGRRVLQLSFTLRRRARVQLRAMRSGRVVARTRVKIMGKGRRRLRLRLHPRRWPTRLDLRVRAVKGGSS